MRVHSIILSFYSNVNTDISFQTVTGVYLDSGSHFPFLITLHVISLKKAADKMLCNVTLCSKNNIHSVQFSPIYEHIKSHCSQKSPVSSYGTFCQACGREYVCVLRARTEQQWYPTIQCDGRCDFFGTV